MSTDLDRSTPAGASYPQPVIGPKTLRFGLAPSVGRNDLLIVGDTDADAKSNLPRQFQWKSPRGPRLRLIERFGRSALAAFKARGEKTRFILFRDFLLRRCHHWDGLFFRNTIFLYFVCSLSTRVCV
jgi:hypothetical protein